MSTSAPGNELCNFPAHLLRVVEVPHRDVEIRTAGAQPHQTGTGHPLRREAREFAVLAPCSAGVVSTASEQRMQNHRGAGSAYLMPSEKAFLFCAVH